MLTLLVVSVACSCFDGFGGWMKRRVMSPEREHEIEEAQRHFGLAPEPAWGD